MLDTEELRNEWTLMDESVMAISFGVFKFRVDCGHSFKCAPLSPTSDLLLYRKAWLWCVYSRWSSSSDTIITVGFRLNGDDNVRLN